MAITKEIISKTTLENLIKEINTRFATSESVAELTEKAVCGVTFSDNKLKFTDQIGGEVATVDLPAEQFLDQVNTKFEPAFAGADYADKKGETDVTALEGKPVLVLCVKGGETDVYSFLDLSTLSDKYVADDTSKTVTVTITGNKIGAEVKLSSDENNALKAGADGALYVEDKAAVDITGKIDKVADATELAGNLVKLTADGGIEDATIKAADLITTANIEEKIQTSLALYAKVEDLDKKVSKLEIGDAATAGNLVKLAADGAIEDAGVATDGLLTVDNAAEKMSDALVDYQKTAELDSAVETAGYIKADALTPYQKAEELDTAVGAAGYAKTTALEAYQTTEGLDTAVGTAGYIKADNAAVTGKADKVNVAEDAATNVGKIAQIAADGSYEAGTVAVADLVSTEAVGTAVESAMGSAGYIKADDAAITGKIDKINVADEASGNVGKLAQVSADGGLEAGTVAVTDLVSSSELETAVVDIVQATIAEMFESGELGGGGSSPAA